MSTLLPFDFGSELCSKVGVTTPFIVVSSLLSVVPMFSTFVLTPSVVFHLDSMSLLVKLTLALSLMATELFVSLFSNLRFSLPGIELNFK